MLSDKRYKIISILILSCIGIFSSLFFHILACSYFGLPLEWGVIYEYASFSFIYVNWLFIFTNLFVIFSLIFIFYLPYAISLKIYEKI
ncbi:hypothetical protein Xszus_00802 [Xenorhabdus szentirmaii]|nr:hypothetical protein Xsze_03314 [Xenorhabdus szentirmaii DSM 16338]PHM41125.1 hypothetical protein Xszus_00802 [Xenorhabdus szentirmaii]